MKTNLTMNWLKFLAIGILLSLISSCSQSTKYSCDEEINQWVSNHLKDLQDITRTELAQYPFNYQVAIYRSLTADNKADIWSEKIDSIEYYNWPQNFYPYIDSLKLKINADFFDPENSISSKNYCSTILNYILEINGIDTNQVVCSFFTVMTINEIEDGVYEQQPGPQNCVCNWSITCSLLSAGRCESGLGGCQSTNDGCGFLYMYSCEGDCTEMVVVPDNED
jgi:hypothetical protein